ncbi:hypothetical protein CFI10_14060 [Marinobacterium iners]|jgi:diguanylate cyclase (GGDEF)-like protein/PAS domain S-box-containing protein|uniref:putative bifunctional diguanylate cyclase/phosphodiesterase n=1 Tax=Marinobacterium TaxID=48075 RepID=UPI001A8F210B|nr:EAL domain-containing protein [Marinobacterium iners]QSR36102.1 hypothetical protein CFI10_14060 [Marinobacterium iners]
MPRESVPPQTTSLNTSVDEQLRIMQASLEHLSDLVVVTDADLTPPGPRIVYVNQAVIERTGYDRERLIGASPRLFQGKDTCREALNRIGNALRRGERVREELLNYTSSGDAYWIGISIVPLFDDSGQLTHFVSTQSDITSRKRIESDLLLFRQAIDQSPSSVIITDNSGHITYVNNGFEINSGYSRDDVLGRTPGFRAWEPKSEVEKRAFWDRLDSGLPWRGEFVNRHKQGHRVVKRAVVSPVRNMEGNISHFLSVEQDITAEKEALSQLEYLAYHDPVTQMPNRRLLQQRVEALLHAPLIAPSAALLLIDLDDFKRINDAHGHGFGDRVLQKIGSRLQKQLLSESELVARLGGDEFGVLLCGRTTDAESDLIWRLEALSQQLARPLNIDGETLLLAGSIGVARIPQHGRSFVTLQRNADLALYKAKADGKGGYATFTAELNVAAQRRVRLEESLRLTILRDELSLAVQSQFGPAGDIRGAEVLVRWLRGPEGVPVSPAEFIPVAEASGLIKPLTLTVFRQALEIAAQLKAAGLRIPLSINLSSDLFRDSALIDALVDLVADSVVTPDALMLEITESLFIDTHPDLLRNMARLAELGFAFSLDDFGTGYSNLAYLKRLHLSELKIDKSFVDGLPQDEDNRAIVLSIISIARQLRLRVVAEGVETSAQADFLVAHGCELLQGYLLHKPSPAEEWLGQLMDGIEKNCRKGVDH